MLQREIRALSLKTKSFVDARQEFETLDYNIRQLRGGSECRPFEDSICSNVDESMMSSTRATTPDEIYLEIHKMVKKFLHDNIKFNDDCNVDNISMSIAKFLSHATIQFRESPDETSDEILADVISNFKKFLPANAITGTLHEEKIATFIAHIIGNVNEHVDENHIEILREIIINTIESANQSAISSNSYLQHLITEIFKMMILTLRIPDDISEDECTREIVDRLSRLNNINARSINVEETVEDILDYAMENLEDGIDPDILKKIINYIVGKL